MAITQTIKMDTGLNQKLYLRIDNIKGDKNNIIATVKGYLSQELYNQGKKAVYSFTFAFTPDLTRDNFIIQAYDYVKTLDDFKNAVDC